MEQEWETPFVNQRSTPFVFGEPSIQFDPVENLKAEEGWILKCTSSHAKVLHVAICM